VSLLSISTLGQQLVTAPAANRASIQGIADSLLSVRDHSTLAGVFAFSLGALMYYVVFFRSRLVPRWLSGWGVAAVLLMMTACLLALFSGTPVTGYTLLILPIAVQEIVLAVWLLVKGFDPLAQTSRASSQVGDNQPDNNAEGELPYLLVFPGVSRHPVALPTRGLRLHLKHVGTVCNNDRTVS